MKSQITATLSLLFFLFAGTGSTAVLDTAAVSIHSLQTETMCADKKKPKVDEDEPDCD